MIMRFIQGFCMALADSVPGVSGGTIAFLLGFYDSFIGALADLVSGPWAKRKQALRFLVKLAIGWIAGFVCAVLALTNAFNSNIYAVCSVFLGLIVFAIPVIAVQERESFKLKASNVAAILIGIAVVAAVTYFNPTKGSGGMDLSSPGPLMYVYIAVAGAVCISAMILPGISGSSLLLIFGLYMPVMAIVREVLHLDFSDIGVLVAFVVGVVIGIASVIKLVRWALTHHRMFMMNLIVGLMLGSLYAIVEGPLTMDVPQPAMTIETFGIGWFLLGGAIMAGLQLLQRFFEKRAGQTEKTL